MYISTTKYWIYFFKSRKYESNMFIWPVSLSFFPELFFGGITVPIVYIHLCRPSEDSLQQSAIPDGSPSQDWQSTVGWGDCWIPTKDCSFTIWSRYQ
jgi:hypothetical protein